MSRLRFKKGSGRAEGGAVSEKGNPKVLKLAKGAGGGAIHGSETVKSLARSTKSAVKATARKPYSSAKHSPASDHAPLSHSAKAPKDGVPRRGRK